MTRPAPQATIIELPALPDGWQVVTYAILADGNLAILGADTDLHAEWARFNVSKRTGDPYGLAAKSNARVWTFEGNTLINGPRFPLEAPYPTFDRFQDGRWLVVGRQETVNTRILAADGSEIRRIHLGHSIMRLKIDDADRIWVGWFDEGVFGNGGWSAPGIDGPPSGYGVAAFDDHGSVVAHADPEADMVDCYALNVTGTTAWACIYAGFPILSLAMEATSRWRTTGLDGARAIAVQPPYVLAAGGYSDARHRVALVRLGSHAAEPLGEWELPLKTGFPSETDFVDGRGDTLHVVQDGYWHRWRLNDFLA
jgi:hypothetical protein